MVKKEKNKRLKIPSSIKQENSEQIKKIKIGVIGIGGGGGNIVSEIASKISKATFMAANTDSKSLKGCSRKVSKFQFGQNLTHGLGTGMDFVLGKAAAQSESEKIKKFCQNQDLCILVVSLGGGTGSGAVSTFAKISKNLGNLTYGIFTLPFKFEGERKMEIAINALKETRGYLNAMTIIPNERVFQTIDKDTPLRDALSTINKFLSESLGGLIETIYEPGLINIDFADFKTVLEGTGRLTYLNAVEVQRKEGAIKEAVEKALNSRFYPYTIKGAKGVLFNIIGEKNLSLSDVNQISKTISELANSDAKIIFGVSQRQKQANVIRTILLATGCGMKFVSEKAKIDPNKSAVGKLKSSKKQKKKRKQPISKAGSKKISVQKKAKIKNRKAKKVKNKKAFNLPVVESPVEKEEGQPEQGETKEAAVLESREERIRKNGLQVKREAEEMEKEMVEKEKIWETPAFLRKKFKNEEE